MFKLLTFFSFLVLFPFSVVALPDDVDFEIAPNFPQPVAAATGVVGTAMADGRYLLWDGDTVYRELSPGDSKLETIASGYLGDPGFITINPLGDTALLGQGFGDGTNADLYLIDLTAPTDFAPASAFTTVSHFSGVYLSNSLVALDRGDFGSPAEIVVVDLLSRSHADRAPVRVLTIPAPPAERVEITKPPGSFSASLSVNGGVLYIADPGNGQYKSFSVAAVINAFQTSTPLLWASGTDIGAPFQYPGGGVSGFTATGNLVIAGFGSIVEVNPGSGAIVKTLNPAGGFPFYGIIYNEPLEELVAVEFPAVFGDPLIFHSSSGALAVLPAQSALTLALLTVVLGCIAFVLVEGRRTLSGNAAIPNDN